MWGFRKWFQKLKNGGFLRKNVFKGNFFCDFRLVAWPSLHQSSLNFCSWAKIDDLLGTLFHKKIHFDPPTLAQTQQKWLLFDKTGLKYHLEVRVQHKIYRSICGTPVPAILSHENLTGSAIGAKSG